MDDIRPPKFSAGRPQRPIHDGPSPVRPSGQRGSITIKFTVPGWVRNFHPFRAAKSRLPKRVRQYAIFPKSFHVRVALAVTIIVLLVTEVIPIIQPNLTAKSYALEGADSLLQKTSQTMASKLVYDAKNATYNFNQNYIPTGTADVGQGGALITAVAHADGAKGIDVSDPVSNVDFGLKPTFAVRAAKQEQNRLEYPLANGSGWLIYSFQAGQVKEDIILSHKTDNSMKFSYDLDLGDSLRAQLLKDGSLGIYGSSLPLNGQISTGSDKDAKLLDLARKKAVKDTLLFTVPAPVIKETGKTGTKVTSKFVLKGSELTVETTNLASANYPLTIDPSVYVKSAQKLMRGNNETNVDFDVTNNQILKGSVTGARIPAWVTTGMTVLPTALWGQSVVMAGGYVYVVGGNTGSANVATVYWAQLDTANETVGAWKTNAAYNLPAARSALSLIAYNGYLFAIGGQNATCTAASGSINSGTSGVCKTVFSIKLAANGEPITWNTLGELSTPRRYATAVAYENNIYLMGGQIGGAGALVGVTTVEVAVVNPDGTLGSWSSSGTSALPATTLGASSNVYNGYIYVVGGNTGSTTPTANVYYAKITSTGLGAWVATNSITTGRQTFGGNFTTIWGGYLYVSGGCSVVNASNYCTTPLSDTQLASINADGSLTTFDTLPGVTQSRFSAGFATWRDTLYTIGGCTAMNTSTGACTTTVTSTSYGVINGDGDVSPITTGGVLPPAGTGATAGQGGRLAAGVVINNGFIYNIGGCYRNDCSDASGTQARSTSYAAIDANGNITNPATCVGTVAGVWCVDTTNTLNGTTGLAAFGTTVFNNRIYAYGGSTGTNGFNTTALFYVALNANGSLAASWTSAAQTVTGLSTTARGYTFMFAQSRTTAPATIAGNMYFMGGCTGASGVGCSAYRSDVYKCDVAPNGAVSNCTLTGQAQIDGDPNTAGTQGLGIFAGVFYGNYIYLAGGANGTGDANAQVDTVYYAKLDASGNIVNPTSLSGASGVVFGLASNRLPIPRRRTFAFGLNGYLYVLAGHDGRSTTLAANKTLNDIVYAKIDLETGDIGAFTTSATTITKRWDLRAAAANGTVYALGGCNTGDPPATCGVPGGTGAAGVDGILGTDESFSVYNNSSGAPVSYVSPSTSPSTNQFTTDRLGASAVSDSGNLYLAGGCTSTTDCTTYTNTTQYATIDASGVTTWAAGPALPATRGFGCMVAQGDYLYYLGGRDASASAYSTVYYSQLVGGVPQAWATATRGIGQTSAAAAVARHNAGCAVVNNRIYLSGGSDAAGTPVYYNTVYASPSLPSGGNITGDWTSTTAFSQARNGQVMISYAGNLYILGGFDGTNYLLDVQYAKVNNDATGTLSAWTASASLPQPVRQGAGFGSNGFMYIFGGRSAANTCTTNTYVAPINGNTPISSGNDPTGLGNWSQTAVNFTTARYGLAAALVNGKAYLMGGACGATLTYSAANRVSYTTLQNQPQIAKFSYVVDTDSDVFPSKTLFNGIDNGIGASWQLSYRSSTDATAVWGLTTNYGDLTLGTPQAYIPIDAAGTNTNFSRYHFIELTIDVSQAFGYPEDISRGPTITDLTFQFSADPSKRLRNGKTFTGGEQQPLDTPF